MTARGSRPGQRTRPELYSERSVQGLSEWVCQEERRNPPTLSSDVDTGVSGVASKPQRPFDLGAGFPTLGGLGGGPQCREETDGAGGEAVRLSVKSQEAGSGSTRRAHFILPPKFQAPPQVPIAE